MTSFGAQPANIIVGYYTNTTRPEGGADSQSDGQAESERVPIHSRFSRVNDLRIGCHPGRDFLVAGLLGWHAHETDRNNHIAIPSRPMRPRTSRGGGVTCVWALRLSARLCRSPVGA